MRSSTGTTWRGHAGAAKFYSQLLSAFPDIQFRLTDIVIGAQGVCDEAEVTASHRGQWLGRAATNERVNFRVVIFFSLGRTARQIRG